MKKGLLLLFAAPLLLGASLVSKEEEIQLSSIKPSFETVGYSSLCINQDMDGNKLSLLINNTETEFDSGFFAHAYSTIMFDKLYDLNIKELKTYVGINKSARGNSNTSMKFYIYGNQTKIYESDIINNDNPCEYIDYTFSFKVNTLTFVIDDLGGNGNDHGVLADTKIIVGGTK